MIFARVNITAKRAWALGLAALLVTFAQEVRSAWVDRSNAGYCDDLSRSVHVNMCASGELRAACRNDYFAFCTGVTPGDGRILACLNQHLDKISAACKNAIARTK